MRYLPEVQAQKELEATRKWLNIIEIRNRFKNEMETLGAFTKENERVLRELNNQVKGGPDRIMEIDNLYFYINL